MGVINVFEVSSKLASPASRVSSVKQDNSGELALAKANGALVDTAIKGAFSLKDAMDNADLMKANNEYNEKMAKLQTQLMNNKEENAKDNLSKFEEGRRKIVGEVFKNSSPSLRYGKNALRLQNTLDRDWVGQRTQMERYQIGELEKYQNTQLYNQLDSTLKDVAANYNDEAALKGYLNRGDAMTALRFNSYGTERIKAAQNKWHSQVVGMAVNAAMGADNYARAGELLQGYGYMMDPAQRINVDKLISAREKSDSELGEYQTLYSKFGKDIEGAISSLKGSYGTANIAKGLAFAQGEVGKAWGSNQCANFVKSYIKASGGDDSLTSSLADGTYRNAEEKGLTFSDRAELRDGDIVYWSVDGSKYSASSDPKDIDSASKAYKGITHVGIYNAKTGKVIQSGEHGVSEMALDAKGYNVVGFSHIGGRAMSLSEQERIEKGYRSYAANKAAQEKAAINLMVENASDEMLAAYNQGERSPEFFNSLAKRIAGNDYSAYTALMTVAKSFGGGGSAKPTLAEQLEIEDAIDAGGLSQKELVEKLAAKGYSTETIMKYVHMNKQANKSAQAEKFDWGGVMAALKERVGGKLPAELVPGLQRYGKRAVREYIEDKDRGNGKAPSVDWVLDTLQEATVKGVGGVEVGRGFLGFGGTEYNNAELANHNIYYIDRTEEGYINVYFYGRSTPERISDDNFKNIMDK